MRIAIVCDDLIQFGGAEKLVMAVSEIWPDAPIYTSVISEKWKEICIKKRIEVRTSFMQKLPAVEKLNRYYSPFFLHCLAFESFNLNDFEIVLSISSRFSHGAITQPQTKHICYMNSPGRMFWESDSYFEKESYGILKLIKFLARPFLSLSLSILKLWDYTASHRVNYFIANSKTPQARIKKYYGIEAPIIYPFVDMTNKPSSGQGDYFLTISRLQSWKRLDIVVNACSKLNLSLKIIGDGPDMQNLKNIAGSSVEFLGYVDDKKKNELLGECKALIQAQKEDFE
jgi:glycosyltransferase involved in cell wall biosynthesis